MHTIDIFLKELEESFIPTSDTMDVSGEVVQHAVKLFELELSELYYGSLYILPLTQEAEMYREMLYKEGDIGRYGAYEINFKYKNETFLAILVNND